MQLFRLLHLGEADYHPGWIRPDLSPPTQFLHQPEASSIAATGGPARPPNQLAVLSVAPSDLAPHRLATECPAEGPVHVEEYFLAASENGVIVAPRPDRTGTTGDAAAQRPPPRLCAIEGTLATLQ